MQAPKSLDDFPNEIFTKIIEYAVVDASPIVDPHGRGCTCRKNSFASLPYQRTVPLKSRSLAKRCHLASYELTRQARKTICQMAGLDATECIHKIGSTGVSVGILMANRLCHSYGVRYLYRKNVFMFTSPTAIKCFSDCYGDTVCTRIKHVVLPMQLQQWDADAVRHLHQQSHYQELPHGPWLSRNIGEPAFASDARKLTTRDQWYFWHTLKTLKFHFMDWQQVEIVDVNGTPGVEAEPFYNPLTDREETLIPDINKMKFERRLTKQFLKNAPVESWLDEMINSGWTAEQVILSGMEDTDVGRRLQKKVNATNLRRRQIAFEGADWILNKWLTLEDWWVRDRGIRVVGIPD